MMEFFWKIRYALILRGMIRPRIKALWSNANDAYADNQGVSTPREAVTSVLSWDVSVEQHNAEVDQKKADKRERQAKYKH